MGLEVRGRGGPSSNQVHHVEGKRDGERGDTNEEARTTEEDRGERYGSGAPSSALAPRSPRRRFSSDSFSSRAKRPCFKT